jgi:hypothetical protein
LNGLLVTQIGGAICEAKNEKCENGKVFHAKMFCNYLKGCGRSEKKLYFFSLLPHFGVFFWEN